MTSPLLVEVRGNVQIMTLNRPEARNAATLEMSEAMVAALDALDADPALSVGIITGAGGSFCAGMDLKGFLQGKRPSVPGRGFCGVTMRPPKKPLIAAVEGYALAGGFEVVLACDLIVAARNAQFGLPEVKRGLAATAGGLMRLPKRLPYHVAMECILTGDMLGAERASATASSIIACVTTVSAVNDMMQPFCAPFVRSTRVRRRVSMSAMATVPSRTRYSVSVRV